MSASKPGVLELSPVQVGDEGELTCRAHNSWGSLHSSLSLSVQSECSSGWVGVEGGVCGAAGNQHPLHPHSLPCSPLTFREEVSSALGSAVKARNFPGIESAPALFLPGQCCGVGWGGARREKPGAGGGSWERGWGLDRGVPGPMALAFRGPEEGQASEALLVGTTSKETSATKRKVTTVQCFLSITLNAK